MNAISIIKHDGYIVLVEWKGQRRTLISTREEWRDGWAKELLMERKPQTWVIWCRSGNNFVPGNAIVNKQIIDFTIKGFGYKNGMERLHAMDQEEADRIDMMIKISE